METKTNVIRYYVLQATEVICLSPTPFSLRDLGLAAGDVGSIGLRKLYYFEASG